MHSDKIQILNIPNFYCTFYIKVLSLLGKIQAVSDSSFSKYDFWPLLIFRWQGKLIVIDNNDPVGPSENLYEQVDLYFVTNKLKNDPRYDRPRIFSLFPHYPINILPIYLRLFFLKVGLKNLLVFLREAVRIWKMSKYLNHTYKERGKNFVFFSGSIWKKEFEANKARSEFIQFCKEHKDIEFVGGFIPRTDGENQGFENLLNSRIYSPRKFNQLIQRSTLGFNNPAVLGAVSWRFAEYLNTGVPLVSLPFKIELPVYPKDLEEIIMISEDKGVKEQLEIYASDLENLQQIGKGGKAYFENYCTVQCQADYLMTLIFK